MLAAGGAFVVWGVLPAYWKALQHVPPLEILCHRIIWSLVFLTVLSVCQGTWTEIVAAVQAPRTLRLTVVSGGVIGLNWLLYIWAVNSGHVLGTSLGYYMTPLVNILLGAAFFAERMRRGQAVAVGLAAVGVVNLTFGYGRFPWFALALAVSFASYGAMRKAARGGSTTGLALETLLLAGPALGYLIWLDARGEGAFGRDGFATSALLVGAGLATSLPLVGFAYGVRRLQLMTIGLLQYLAPSIAFLLGVFAYREPFSGSHLITFGCVWVALTLYTVEGMARSRHRLGLARPQEIAGARVRPGAGR